MIVVMTDVDFEAMLKEMRERSPDEAEFVRQRFKEVMDKAAHYAAVTPSVTVSKQ